MKNKTAFVITAFHHNDWRPRGRELAYKLVESIRKHVKTEYKIFVLDASPDIEFKYRNDEDIEYAEIRNQKQIGLTGTWNLGCKDAYESGYDIIMNLNDDLTVDNTINSLIAHTSEVGDEDKIFGPVCNPEGVSTHHQRRSGPGNKIIECTNTPWNGRKGYAINGFFYCFHREFFKKHSVSGNLFSTRDQDMWGGQENELFDRCTPNGMRSFIYEPCYVNHVKFNTWKKGSMV